MTRTFGRAVLAAGVALLLWGCQSMPEFKPDPKLKTASMGELQRGVAASCIKVQKAKQSASTAELSRPCGCYASGALKAMDKTEIGFYRENGYFADSARPKAQAAMNACGLS
ncbi:MAG: hypothetical protein LCH61_15730 [Proteobacteria bacterium]|nr:hypothetical protein [Pseudomonadota bacterium]